MEAIGVESGPLYSTKVGREVDHRRSLQVASRGTDGTSSSRRMSIVAAAHEQDI